MPKVAFMQVRGLRITLAAELFPNRNLAMMLSGSIEF